MNAHVEHETHEGIHVSGAAVVAVPEENHLGESKPNWASERAVQIVDDLVRTCKLALAYKLNTGIPMDHPGMSWMVEHAGADLTRYHEHEDGTACYEKPHCTHTRKKIAGCW